MFEKQTGVLREQHGPPPGSDSLPGRVWEWFVMKTRPSHVSLRVEQNG